jgi:lysozyme
MLTTILNPKNINPTSSQPISALLQHVVNVVTKKPAANAHSISAAGIQLIKNFEGLRLQKYNGKADKKGVWTIGYGHVIKPGENFAAGINEYQANQLLLKDLKYFENLVNSCVLVPLSQNQFDALVSLVFNIGGFNFRRSTLLMLLNRRQYFTASQQFMVWVKSGAPLKTVAGLIARRKAEQTLFNKP